MTDQVNAELPLLSKLISTYVNGSWSPILAATAKALEAEVERLKALSVTNILLEVVPGDGSGHEVYAKMVADVEAKLSTIWQELEAWQLGIRLHSSSVRQLAAKDREIGRLSSMYKQAVIATAVATVPDKVNVSLDYFKIQALARQFNVDYNLLCNAVHGYFDIQAKPEQPKEACTDERMCVPCYTGQGTCATNCTTAQGLITAAVNLMNAVEAQHEKPSPLKYCIPYGAVNALRNALDSVTAAPQPPAKAQPEEGTW